MASVWTFVFLLGNLFVFGRAACPIIVSRAQCNLRAPTGTADTLSLPVPTVVIHHGASEQSCTTQADCCAIVRAYQDYHMDENGWIDIGFNFLVGEDGSVYEGRGWTGVGAHAAGCNTKSIGIAFIGDFTSRPPNAGALTAGRLLIECGVGIGVISGSYRVSGHRDSGTTSTTCPGNSLFTVIQTWPNFTTNPQCT